MSRSVGRAILPLLVLLASEVRAYPSVFPTGTTIYQPDRTYDGYTLIGMSWWGGHTYLIDMNGNVVKEWQGLIGHTAYLLPGGHVIGQTGGPKKAYLQQRDWDGDVVWSFEDAYMSHDMNREGFPAGYYSPEADPMVTGGRTLLNAQFPAPKGERIRPEITRKAPAQGQYILEIDWDGEVLWEWNLNDYVEDLELSPGARESMQERPSMHFINNGLLNAVDWAHVNAMAWLGPNKWYDAGDERFHPENVIWSSRNTSIIAITSRKTGEIVWQIGPDYTKTEALRALGPILGSHGIHMIPRGLRGAGNLLVFDNGAPSIYGSPNQISRDGRDTTTRGYSRVLEIDPTTLEVVWIYTAEAAGHAHRRNRHQFYSPFQSNAQRLPNGNTLVTEAVHGRVFELTEDLSIVWEFVEPSWRQAGVSQAPIFRAYRVPYEWVPQLEPPEPTAVVPPAVRRFRLEARGEETAQPVLID